MTKMKKLLFLAFVFAIGSVGCADKANSSSKSRNILPADSLVRAYDDDMLSLLLPQRWTVETDTVETWAIRHVVDSLGIKSGIVELYSPNSSFKIRIVKSAMRWSAPDSPATDWAGLSQYNANNDPSCIYISDVTDSISIDGKDACNYLAAFDSEGDTIVQDQFIVLKNKYDLYYINGIYDYGDNVSPELFRKILSTIKLK